MAELDREKMLKKYKYLTNTTKSAQERMLPERELPCVICGRPITARDVYEDNCEANINKRDWIFFHRTCALNN